MRTLALSMTLLVLSGCDGYQRDVETICKVRSLVTLPAGADAAAQETALTSYLMLNIHSPKAKKMFATLGSLSPLEKAKALRREATAVGVKSCALADEFDPAGK